MIDITLSNGACSRGDGRLHTGRPGRCSATGPATGFTVADPYADHRKSLKWHSHWNYPGDGKIEFAKTKGNGAAWQIITAYFDPRHARFEPWLGSLRGYSTSEDAAAVDLLRVRRELFSRR